MPGQPPSWNHMYRWTTKRSGGREIRIQVKTDEANLYQSQLTMVARAAKPSGFAPTGKIIVAYDMHLDHDLDADNVMKAVNDALALALNVNDKRFLPITTNKTTGSANPWLEVHVYDALAWRVSIDPMP
jgi:Holliday junction resolvase RusA-like endonuclease